MPGARGARCGAALWLGLLGGIFCRAWTAPATSLEEVVNGGDEIFKSTISSYLMHVCSIREIYSRILT
ncbi:hypothetical protein E5288_WYG012411 [Bos mutus]|uniref:Uncharacterized protein n=1 Tax=Bos mutus TaxID=72004 RepID=A0A6B0RQ15_9CETA|nr:hypothetical protein [Bos mutus]